MTWSPPDLVRAGMVRHTHGISGHLILQFDSEIPALAEGAHLFLEKEGELLPCFVRSWEPWETESARVLLEEFPDKESAQSLARCPVWLDRQLAPERKDVGHPYQGLLLRDATHEKEGMVEAVQDMGEYLLLTLRVDDESHMVPLHPDMVESQKDGKIHVRLPEGIFGLED